MMMMMMMVMTSTLLRLNDALHDSRTRHAARCKNLRLPPNE
jgi:hypothetical protein